MNGNTENGNAVEVLALEVKNTSSAEIVVKDQIGYEQAGKFLLEIANRKKQVTDFFREPKEKAHEAHKIICLKEKELLAPLEDMERKVKRLMGEYFTAEQERIRAEEERRRLESEKMMELAMEAESSGDSETAQEAVAVAALEASKVTVAPKAQGTSARFVWKYRVVDLNQVPETFVIRMVDSNMLNAICRGIKDNPTKQIPGIEFYRETILSVRTR